eukprot:9948409-Lingulodinium_polyedra.AAC.1
MGKGSGVEGFQTAQHLKLGAGEANLLAPGSCHVRGFVPDLALLMRVRSRPPHLGDDFPSGLPPS